MRLSIELNDRHFLFLVGMLAVVSVIGIVSGYGGSNPSSVGHTPGEIAGGTFAGGSKYVFPTQVEINNTSPMLKLDDNETDYWMHVNNNQFYILWDGDDDGIWEGPHPFRITNRNAVFGGSVTATSFLYSSDASLKENVQPVPNALDRVLELEGVSFDWKSGGRDMGLIAQDVEDVFPEIVHTDPETGLKSVEYGNLVAVLIEAMREQQKQIDELKERC